MPTPENYSEKSVEARSKELIGKGESSRIAQVGLAEAAVTLQKVGAYRDPRLYALNVFADRFSQSVQPLVPSRLFEATRRVHPPVHQRRVNSEWRRDTKASVFRVALTERRLPRARPIRARTANSATGSGASVRGPCREFLRERSRHRGFGGRRS